MGMDEGTMGAVKARALHLLPQQLAERESMCKLQGTQAATRVHVQEGILQKKMMHLIKSGMVYVG